MARTIIDEGEEYQVFSAQFGMEDAKVAETAGERVYVSHSCPECGRELFGTIRAYQNYGDVPCQEHNSRYINQRMGWS